MLYDLLHVLGDPAHWIAEVVMDGVFSLIAYPAIRLFVTRHDRRTHGLHRKEK